MRQPQTFLAGISNHRWIPYPFMNFSVYLEFFMHMAISIFFLCFALVFLGFNFEEKKKKEKRKKKCFYIEKKKKKNVLSFPIFDVFKFWTSLI